MTDVSPVKAHADPQPPLAVPYGDHISPPYTNGSPALDGAHDEEESSTIKCICGFADDDGDTVLCEKCDTWQHIVCYYESAEFVPEVHECTDCHPRPVDRRKAIEKQTLRREAYNIGERKGKPKTASKAHKRRAKDALGSGQPNGWGGHSNDLYYLQDRKSGSPRDQPPPSKRPKTNHRTSGSVSIGPDGSLVPRKRTGSSMHFAHSPEKSPPLPDDPDERYSPQFMNLYRQGEPTPTAFNSYTDLSVANDISLWCQDREALAEATGGLQPGQVFRRIDQTIEQLDSLAPPLAKQTVEYSDIVAHGHHPRFQYLTIDKEYGRPVPAHSYIGEVKGRIGRKQAYCADSENRWSSLLHPEPFVFFPPYLPLYIDNRQEGTILRYVRRSCVPNLQMQIMTHMADSSYHFCLIALHEIQAGEELTIGWELDPQIRQTIQDSLNTGKIHKEGFTKIQPWISRLLANFGECACDKTKRSCLFESALRPSSHTGDHAVAPKATKGRKTKKTHLSPSGTGHAPNSRAGSEGLHRNAVDDYHGPDHRSTSGSRKSTSRDITPATHPSVDSAEPKMSDRERRKLQQSERLFEQLEYDEQHKNKKAKRNSAATGSNAASLPSAVRRLSRPSVFYTNADQQKTLSVLEQSPPARDMREHSHGVPRKVSGSTKSNGRSIREPKPVYVDASTQTDTGLPSPPAVPTNSTQTDTGLPSPPVVPATPTPVPSRARRSMLSFKQNMFKQTIEGRAQTTCLQSQESPLVKPELRSPALEDVAIKSPALPPTQETADGGEPMQLVHDGQADRGKDLASTSIPMAPVDVEMKDADASEPADPVLSKPQLSPHDSKIGLESAISSPPAQSAAVAAGRPSSPATDPPQPSVEAVPVQTVELRVQPPLEPINGLPSNTSAVAPSASLGVTSILATPGGASLSPHPPSTATTSTSAPRKKLSLSDYTRRAKLAQSQSATSATSPASQPNANSSPTLSVKSLPGQQSPSTKTPEPSTLSTVMENPVTSG